MTYNIEITDEERAFLYGALNLVDNAISGVPYDSSTAIIDVDKMGIREAVDYLYLLTNTAAKIIEDIAGRDQKKARRLLDSLYKKVDIYSKNP